MKYPSLNRLGDERTDGILAAGEVVITEKIDGANFRWKYDVGLDDFFFGSKNHLFIENDKPVSINRVNKAFRHTVRHIWNTVDKEQIKDIYEQYGDIWFYGEAFHKHTVDYDAYSGKEPDVDSETPNYIGFDIRTSEGEFLPHETVVEIHDQLGLETVPVIDEGPATEFSVDSITVPQSEYRIPDEDAELEFNRDGLAEGVVIKNSHTGQRAKYTHETFKEKHKAVFESNSEDTSPQAGRIFIGRYLTDARVGKMMHKLRDEGQYEEVSIEMMQDLPRRVLEDILQEEGWEIMTDEDISLTPEIKEYIRSKTSTKCSRVIRNHSE